MADRHHETSRATGERGSSRREFLKHAGAVAGGVALGGGLAGQAAGGTRRLRRQQAQTLNLLSWPGRDKYELGAFEKQHNVTVKVKEYTGDEQMLAIANSTPLGTFDAVVVDREYVPLLKDADKIVELNPKDFPEYKNFFPEYRRMADHWIGGKLYSVVTRFGYLGLAYNSKKLTAQDVSSYKILWDKKLNGKVGWFDWYLPSMGNLSQYLGHHKTPFDISNDDFDKLKSTLFSLKGQSSGFYAMADVFSSLSNGDAWVIPGVGAWVATLLQLQGHPVAATIPKEGGLQWTESVSIFKNARNPDLAVKYIQYLTTPEGQVKEATLPAYSAAIPSRTGWALLTKQKPTWANRLGLNPKRHPNVIDQFRAGDIALRDLPKRQSIEDWNGAWTQFKNK